MSVREQVIFEYSRSGRGAQDQWPAQVASAALDDLPPELLRKRLPTLPEVGELETIRHFWRDIRSRRSPRARGCSRACMSCRRC